MAASKGSKVFVWIILGLLFVGLMGFGTLNLSGSATRLGTVGEKDISINRYYRTLSEQLNAFSAQVGTTVSFTQAQSLGLDRQVLNDLVNQRVLDNAASELGLSVGDERVREQVLNISAFQGFDGKFDRDAYRDALSRIGESEAEFEASLREEMARTMVQAAIIGGVAPSEAYADLLLGYISERRDVTYAFIDPALVSAPIAEPTEADLTAYYEANPEEFTIPETKEITYAWLTPEMLMDKVEVDEQALRDLYEERSADYIFPERRLVERLIYGDAAAAEAAIARVTAGEATFEDLVAERGLAMTDTDMGDVAIDDLGAAGETIFAAETGTVVGPLDTDLGPALFRVNAILAAEETTFDEARDDLRAELATARARRQITDTVESLTDLIAGGATIEDLVERSDLELGTIEFNETVIDGIAAYDSFRTAAASTSIGDYPEIIEMADGGVFALRVDALREPALQEQADVADAVLAGWQEEAASNALFNAAEALIARLEAGESYADLGLVPMRETDLTRRSFIEGTPVGFGAAIFNMDQGTSRSLADDTGLTVVITLDAIKAPDLNDTDTIAQRASLLEQSAAGLSQDLFDATLATIRKNTEITLDQAAINAVHTQLQ